MPPDDDTIILIDPICSVLLNGFSEIKDRFIDLPEFPCALGRL